MTKHSREAPEGTRMVAIDEREPPVEDRPYVIILGGDDIGQVFRIDHTMTIGRDSSAEICLSDDRVSRTHARIVLTSVGVLLSDIGSSNGTRVNGAVIERPVYLKDGDKIAVGSTTILKFSYHDHLEVDIAAGLSLQARRDPVTGVWSRAYVEERLHDEVAFARRHSQPLAVLILSIDGWPALNDMRGRPAAEGLLIALGRRLQATLRADDLLGRFGDDTFVILSRGSGVSRAMAFAERVRLIVAHAAFRLSLVPGLLPATITVGVGVYPGPGDVSPNDLVDAALRALSEGQEDGRNRVAVSLVGPTDDLPPTPGSS